MRPWIDALRAAFERLSRREQVLVAATGSVFLVLLLVFGAIQPLVAAVDRSAERAEDAARRYELARQWRARLDQVNARLAAVERRIASDPERNLRSILDRLRSQAGISKFDSIDERPGRTTQGYRETQLEIVLSGVTLAQVVKYLHAIESAPEVLSVKRLRVAIRAQDDELLDVRFTVSAFEPA